MTTSKLNVCRFLAGIIVNRCRPYEDTFEIVMSRVYSANKKSACIPKIDLIEMFKSYLNKQKFFCTNVVVFNPPQTIHTLQTLQRQNACNHFDHLIWHPTKTTQLSFYNSGFYYYLFLCLLLLSFLCLLLLSKSFGMKHYYFQSFTCHRAPHQHNIKFAHFSIFYNAMEALCAYHCQLTYCVGILQCHHLF